MASTNTFYQSQLNANARNIQAPQWHTRANMPRTQGLQQLSNNTPNMTWLQWIFYAVSSFMIGDYNYASESGQWWNGYGSVASTPYTNIYQNTLMNYLFYWFPWLKSLPIQWMIPIVNYWLNIINQYWQIVVMYLETPGIIYHLIIISVYFFFIYYAIRRSLYYRIALRFKHFNNDLKLASYYNYYKLAITIVWTIYVVCVIFITYDLPWQTKLVKQSDRWFSTLFLLLNFMYITFAMINSVYLAIPISSWRIARDLFQMGTISYLSIINIPILYSSWNEGIWIAVFMVLDLWVGASPKHITLTKTERLNANERFVPNLDPNRSLLGAGRRKQLIFDTPSTNRMDVDEDDDDRVTTVSRKERYISDMRDMDEMRTIPSHTDYQKTRDSKKQNNYTMDSSKHASKMPQYMQSDSEVNNISKNQTDNYMSWINMYKQYMRLSGEKKYDMLIEMLANMRNDPKFYNHVRNFVDHISEQGSQTNQQIQMYFKDWMDNYIEPDVTNMIKKDVLVEDDSQTDMGDDHDDQNMMLESDNDSQKSPVQDVSNEIKNKSPPSIHRHMSSELFGDRIKYGLFPRFSWIRPLTTSMRFLGGIRDLIKSFYCIRYIGIQYASVLILMTSLYCLTLFYYELWENLWPYVQNYWISLDLRLKLIKHLNLIKNDGSIDRKGVKKLLGPVSQKSIMNEIMQEDDDMIDKDNVIHKLINNIEHNNRIIDEYLSTDSESDDELELLHNQLDMRRKIQNRTNIM